MTPVVETPRLLLTPVEERHLTERYLGWLNDPQVVRYSELRHCRQTMDACRAYLKAMRESQHAFWAVETRDGRHIGNMTAVIDRNNDVADLSIMIGDRSVWGQGYGTSAWLGACNYLMGEGNMRKVRAGTMHVNQPMLTLMKKAGMKEDGVWRRHLMFEGREVDVVFAALFRHRG